MDLFKASGSIAHDSLITKMHAYGFSTDSVIFFCFFLKHENKT